VSIDEVLIVIRRIQLHLTGLLVLAAAVWATIHAILHKRDVRAVTGWVAVIWLVPAIGPALYLILGINRIRRRAKRLRGGQRKKRPLVLHRSSAAEVERLTQAPYLGALVRFVDQLIDTPLLGGNHVELLAGGDQAFPIMIRAIEGAQRTITLTTYIFDHDRSGQLFADALVAAARRGVHVRVLVDAVGVRYSRHPIDRALVREGIQTRRFMPSLLPGYWRYINLRSHRKIMVVDGCLGFTGGMNIREGNWLSLEPPPTHPIRDVHVALRGPVVSHLQETFAEDWVFAGGEPLVGEDWFPSLRAEGGVIARGIPDGPDETFEQFRMTLLGALSVCRERVCIVTPYFLPDNTLITALSIVAMRGVTVDIVLPAQSNLRLVQWASQAMLWQVLERGCRVWLTPEPFDHSKLMVVDGLWCLLGSANWDVRSLRLNFEFNVECYDPKLAGAVQQHVEERIRSAKALTLDELNIRSLPVKLRDGVARLFTPYL